MINLARNLPFFRPRADATPGPLDPFWYQPASPPGPSGIVVKPDNAQKVGAVFGCIRVRRECLGSLPWETLRRLDRKDTERDPDYYLWQVLLHRPNSWQTAMEWIEMGVAHVDLRGNYYSRIVMNDAGDIELWPLNPDRMQVEQLPNRQLKYTYTPQPGLRPEIYGSDEIFHVRGLSLNGITGVSVLEFAANTIGLSIAQQTHGASLFRNGGLPTFWIKRPEGKKWTPQAIQNFRSGWNKIHAGPENAGNPPILQDGMTLESLGLTNRDSQWLESLDHNGIDICRFFGVPPHMIGLHAEGVTDVEQLGIEFVRYTLRPLARRFESAADRQLVMDPDRFTRFHLDDLERGQLLTRYQAHNIGIQGGWKTANEARREEGYNPIDGGDTARFPMNMQPAGGAADWNEQGGQPGKGKRKVKGPRKPPAGEERSDWEETQTEDAKAARGEEIAKCKLQNANCKMPGTPSELFEPLLRDCAARIAAAEIRGLESRAEKAAADLPRWKQWALDFYQDLRQTATRILAPAAEAWQLSTDRTIDLSGIDWMPCELVKAINRNESLDVPRMVTDLRGRRAEELFRQMERAFR